MTPLWPATEGGVHYISRRPPAAWAQSRRSLCLLGSTGSIGTSTLKVVEAAPELFNVVALAGARNVTRLAEQATRWRPSFLGVLDAAAADSLKRLLPAGYRPEILTGPEGYATLASLPDVNTVLSAQVGAAGLRGTVAAVLAGKVVCLANKESLVLAGDLVRDLCRRTGASILPVDSEHNAIFQCLAGRPGMDVKNIIITASGGPFRSRSRAELAQVTREQALHHPNWSMGAKISIDSATLMNKGLEIIEARHLYGLPLERITPVIHPQSIIHSLVEFQDGSMLAQMGTPDMRMAIAHCAAWPRCIDSGVRPLSLIDAGALTFQRPDEDAFPCLELARRALREGPAAAVALNAANEIAVALFLGGRCAFLDIPDLVARTMDSMAESADAVRSLPEHCPALTDAVADILMDIERIDGAARARCAALACRPV